MANIFAAPSLHYAPSHRLLAKPGCDAWSVIDAAQTSSAPLSHPQPQPQQGHSQQSVRQRYEVWWSSVMSNLTRIEAGRRVELDLSEADWQQAEVSTRDLPRFSLCVVDASRPSPSSSSASTSASRTSSPAATCGVVLCPQGRECDYMFSHPSGQQQLMRQHGFDRIAFVALKPRTCFPLPRSREIAAPAQTRVSLSAGVRRRVSAFPRCRKRRGTENHRRTGGR